MAGKLQYRPAAMHGTRPAAWALVLARTCGLVSASTDRLRRTEAGRSGRRPDIFHAGLPAGNMLAAGIRVVADVGHIIDVHDEQRELTRHGAPADLSGHRCRVAPLHFAIIFGAHGPAYLDLGRQAQDP